MDVLHPLKRILMPNYSYNELLVSTPAHASSVAVQMAQILAVTWYLLFLLQVLKLSCHLLFEQLNN